MSHPWQIGVRNHGKGFPHWIRCQYHGEGWIRGAVLRSTEDERRREAERWRGTGHRRHRQAESEDEEAVDVQGPDVERRLHADGVRRSYPRAVLQQESRGGD